MLTQDTKRKIQTARDILVGKIPDPKAQVEQITIALMYKFMNDMDLDAISLGGKAKFFSGEFKEYSWSKILDSRIGAQDRLNLYAEAIEKMDSNPNIPQLFRNIFKNAFLPYRDPETLSLFLKQINEFDYEHTEQLGDAFEFLLSIMSSQGDAGQFRTPRHIIDFIVKVVDPKKDQSVLDPACGTAGFLISAFKHVLENNKEKDLTPDERDFMAKNYTGYDISPDMVRLSLVNMYLHGFLEPKIYEYDTLSSEKYWDDKFDVILANPPFMTPKGGINPHNKFGIRANRSEVLFVDYILEHLKLNGKAGIIVPEGIIFQSADAYKKLRKKLVEDGLFCVVSLPAGIFQPYSGVKTSVLLFDKKISKRVSHMMFVKISNDGYSLGAQRTLIIGSDLPMALEAIKGYKEFILSGGTPSKTGWPGIAEVDTNPLCNFVSKEEIANVSDYNLSGDRYRTGEDFSNSKWPLVELGEVVEILDNKRKPITKSERIAGKFPYYGATGILDYVNDYIFDERLVLIGEDGAKWGIGDKTAFTAEGKYWVNNHAHVVRPVKGKLIDTFLVEYLNSIDLSPFITGVTVPKLNQEKLKLIKIPLPPIEIQEQIVKEIDGYQRIIDGAKQIVANWKPKIDIDPGWEWNKIKDIADNGKNSIKAGPFGSSLKKETYVNDGYKIYGQEQVIKDDINYGDYYIDEHTYKKLESCTIKAGDILISLVGTYGKLLVVPEKFKPGIINPRLMKITLNKKKCLPSFFKYIFESQEIYDQVKNMSYGGTMGILNTTILRELKMPVPLLEIQKQIVEKIEAERGLVDSTKKLIKINEEKIKSVLEKLYGDND